MSASSKSSDHDVAIGIGVGVPLGILVLTLAVLLWLEKRKNKTLRKQEAGIVGGDGGSAAFPVSNYHKPELPVSTRAVEPHHRRESREPGTPTINEVNSTTASRRGAELE